MLHRLPLTTQLFRYNIQTIAGPAIAFTGNGYLCGLFLDAAVIPKKFSNAINSNDTVDYETLPLATYLVSDFYQNVYETLLKITPGHTQSYQRIAQDVGRPKACRAVGTAVSRNDVALRIPCHRVVPKSGGIGQYLYGSPLKEHLLKLEKESITTIP